MYGHGQQDALLIDCKITNGNLFSPISWPFLIINAAAFLQLFKNIVVNSSLS